jgi:signal transduction histidine kinase
MKMVKDLSSVDRRVNRLFMQGVAALIVFAVAMGAALWFTLRRTAIFPMEELVREIQELNQGLENRVEERTADLVDVNKTLKLEMTERRKAEESLRRSKEALERQNKDLKELDVMKDALVRNISHELKTPVAKHRMQLEILGDILGEKEVFDSVKDVLQVMEHGIRRQQKAIDNILRMSRLEEGGRSLNLAPFRLDSLIEEIINDYIHAIASYGMRLQMDLTPIMLVSDRDLLWHVFGNIVDNAIKYRRQEDAWLHVQAEVKGNMTLVHVRDNGTGLNREEHERVFERFYQFSSSTEGVGLGLNITKTIVESLGGSIRIESEGKNKGTTVSVTLPAAKEEGREPAAVTLKEHV